MIRARLGQACQRAKLACEAGFELAKYPWRGEAGPKTWEMCLRLHCATNGRSTALMRRIMRRLRPAPAPIQDFASLLGRFDARALADIAEQIRRDGYYVFPARIPESICDEITRTAAAANGWAWRKGADLVPVERFDPEHPIAHRYEFPERETWRLPAYQAIIADPLFVNLSQAYFGGASALKEVSLWWSAAVDDGRPDDDAAQTFHFDYDAAPIWLKYFVYLNDVTHDNGPHVFVRGSHRLMQARARSLLSRGYVRIADQEIADLFGVENVVEIAGRKGTVFVADTMGFHKGKPPLIGNRWIAQLEFATPLFVPAASRRLPMPANATPALLTTRMTYPWAFARFPVSA